MSQYFKIGKLISSYKLKGEMVLKHSLNKKTALKGLKAIFIEENKESFIPYFVSAAKLKNQKEVYIKLEGIDTVEATKKILSKEVWLLEDDFKKHAAASAPISLLGFTIVNEDTELGEIIEVIEQPHQILCTILLKNKEILIPLHEGSLNKIDKKNRKVHVTLPEGLLDIYFQKK